MMLKRLHYRWRYIVAIILSGYSLILLWNSFESQKQLRAAADTRLLANSERSAKTLADFTNRLYRIGFEASSAHELKTYLTNKALGMSLLYGLNSNLDVLERHFRERVVSERSEPSGLRRIAFLNEEGEVLADSGGDKRLSVPAQPVTKARLSLNPEENLIVIYCPVVFKSQSSGTVVVFFNLDRLMKFLINSGGSYHEALITLDGREVLLPGQKPLFLSGLAQKIPTLADGRLVALSDLAKQAHDDRHEDSMVVRASIAGMPAMLITIISKNELYGGLSSMFFLCALSFFPFLVLLAYRKLEAANEKLNSALAELKKTQDELLVKNTELEQAYQAVERVSVVDPLTGMHNRRFLTQHIDAEVAFSVRCYETWNERSDSCPPVDVDVIFYLVDIDHFKQVNDVHGHVAGDAVLIQMRERLMSVVRASDFIVRWGGEEFLVVMRRANRYHAHHLAERIRLAVESRPFDIGGSQVLKKTCSIGFASLPLLPKAPCQSDWNQVISVADHCLYMAKRNGRNAWVGINAAPTSIYDSAAEFVRDIQTDIEAAAQTGQIHIESHFQVPQHSI